MTSKVQSRKARYAASAVAIGLFAIYNAIEASLDHDIQDFGAFVLCSLVSALNVYWWVKLT